MEKKFNIESLKKGTPFKTPEGYFDSLSSRIMSQIPAEPSEATKEAKTEKNAKVVGLMPRKKDRKWLKWGAAIAACVCGLALFLNKPAEEQPQQIAKTEKGEKDKSDELFAEEAVSDVATQAAPKQYANVAFDLSQRRKTSAPPVVTASDRQYTAYTPAQREVVSEPVVKASSNNVVKAAPAAKTASPSTNTNVAASTTRPANIQSTLAAALEDMDDYDILDYTQMSGSEIYDYLAGNDYY